MQKQEIRKMELENNPKRMGKNILAIGQWIVDIKKGKNVRFIGSDFICMSKKDFESELLKRDVKAYKEGWEKGVAATFKKVKLDEHKIRKDFLHNIVKLITQVEKKL